MPGVDRAGGEDDVGGIDGRAAVLVVREGRLRVRGPAVEALEAQGSVEVQAQGRPRVKRLIL